ncbi:MAG: helix-turn-helix domain-containing protein [Beijerinckiaceae bacterium]
MTHTLLKTPGGEELVLMPRAAFDALRDALDAAEHRNAMASVAAGALETLSAAEVVAALEEPTPLAFWRKKRGLTQTALAAAAGIKQPYMAGLEKGDRKGDPALFLKLARALKVRMEDLVEGG